MPIAQKNLSLNPDGALAHRTLGVVHQALGHDVDAEYFFRGALRLDPEDTEAAIALARLLRDQGRDDEAGKVYLGAAAVDPTDSRIRQDLARLGLPVLGVVGAGAGFGVLKYVAAVGAQSVVRTVSFGVLSVVFLVGMLTLSVTMISMQVAGGRSLPEPVRHALKADYRNSALRWGSLTGWGCLLLSVYGLFDGSQYTALLLALLGLALVVARRVLWSGPRPSRRSLHELFPGLVSLRERFRRTE